MPEITNEAVALALGYKHLGGDLDWWESPDGLRMPAEAGPDGGLALPDFLHDMNAAQECWHALPDKIDWMLVLDHTFRFVNPVAHIACVIEGRESRYAQIDANPATAICKAFMAEKGACDANKA